MTFAESERILEAAAKGANLREACEKAGIPYGTARGWIERGRRDPEGPYGAWVRRLDATKAPPTDASASDGGVSLEHAGDSGPGPVEFQLDALLGGRELTGENALAAEQARVLARKVDQLGETPGAAAGQALAHCSRRLEEIVPALGVPREDSVDRLRKRRALRRAAVMQSNGRGSGEIELDGDGRL